MNIPPALATSFITFFNAQVQASMQVSSPLPAGSALDNSQQNTADKPTLTKEETLQRVYLAVKLSEKYNKPFWSDLEQKQLNNRFSSLLQRLSEDMIKEALKSLQWQGFIAETKPGYWHAVKDLHLVDILAYDNPDMPVYCPNCMKPVARLYWYDTEWLCADCLNERQHQNEELYS